jgi:hypothetical protein
VQTDRAVIVDRGAQILEIALGAAALAFVRFSLASALGFIAATQAGIDLVKRLIAEKQRQSLGALERFCRPCLARHDVRGIDADHVRD